MSFLATASQKLSSFFVSRSVFGMFASGIVLFCLLKNLLVLFEVFFSEKWYLWLWVFKLIWEFEPELEFLPLLKVHSFDLLRIKIELADSIGKVRVFLIKLLLGTHAAIRIT